ncbi:MAG: alpha/beta hydrolase family protein [Gemmobacter sp.]|uniref:alpha/beta hydrolase family protein n=1 Tax=Gemmobacter sp. TaxID=1898957 RepID=UPI003919E088
MQPSSTRLRARLRRLFELDLHPLTECPGAATALPAPAGTVAVQLAFRSASGEPVRGIWLRPEGAAPVPAVLVIHAHGNRHAIGADELLKGRPALQGPIGPALAARGIASLCLDMPGFGARLKAADGVANECAAAKAALWHGRSLAGQMLGENAWALGWLAAQPAVRADRLGVFGISMGATLGYWLAAADLRVRALAHECCLADFAALIASGAHDLHGPYLTVPGLLRIAPNGRIAGLVAPRAQFAGLGDRDPLTPPEATAPALAQLRAAYRRAGGTLQVHREPDEGHRETAAMRAAVLDFLAAELA